MRYRAGPVKLIDCERHGPGCELFVVEGDSAASAVAALRDATFQAVLPMQGKPMNALRATPAKTAGYPLFQAIEMSLGVRSPLHSAPSSLPFERVLLLFDPDADGIHCGALMLMYFYARLRPLLEAGCVHMVYPPWVQFSFEDGAQAAFAYTEAQGQDMAAKLRAGGKAFTTQRPRGLAGIDAALLQQTCIAPSTRRSRVLGVADAQMAISVFDVGVA
jgi:DNA gyrase subunit B